MAKEIKKLIISIEDTDNPGSPDKLEYTCLIVDTVDPCLTKGVSGEVDDPDFTKSGATLYNDVKTTIKTAEGIS